MATAQTSVFTYQGKLTDAGANANGPYDFIFRLYDENSNPIGPDAARDDVQVIDGIFTVSLDFGANAFSNTGQRFLEIHMRAGASTDEYTMLTPRQQITSSPFSIQTLRASSADSLSTACVLCVTDAQIQTIDGSKVTGTVANATTAVSVSSIVPIANGGTGSSTQNFVDLSTDQPNIGGNKTFTGTLSGNGSGLTNVPGTLKWQAVSGPAQQAQPNNGYLANGAGPVTITLPESAALNAGDVVRVSGSGTGGWKILQNAGQSIIGTYLGLFGANWTPRESSRRWFSIASSADGTKLAAVVFDGQIYTSADSGITWTPRESNRRWLAVASSADGTKLIAVVNGGQIYTSTDSGLSWMPRESDRDWIGIASSADGTKLVAAVVGGQIYTSADSGVAWTPREGSRNWGSLASSADGTKLAAVVQGGQIYTSVDSGVSWTPRESSRPWFAIASSADGTKLAAVVNNGQIFTSADSGVSWTPRESSRMWGSIASSADGTKLAAAAFLGQVYTSSDSGVSWTPRDVGREWMSVASSADGTKLAAVVDGGQIYTTNFATTVGTAGSLTGGQFSAIELQYIGNGQFIPLSYSGSILGF